MKYKVNTPSLEAKVILYAIFFALMMSLQAIVAFAQEKKEVQIFEVRKLLQLTSKDPIIRDYYVNAGQEMGLKEGAFVAIYRKTPLADPYKQQTQAHVELPVGVMKIIYSDRTMAIGRVSALRSAKDSPVLDGEGFMVGDRVDLGSLSFDKKADSPTSTESAKPSETVEKKEEPQPRKNASVEPVKEVAKATPPRQMGVPKLAPPGVEVIAK